MATILKYKHIVENMVSLNLDEHSMSIFSSTGRNCTKFATFAASGGFFFNVKPKCSTYQNHCMTFRIN